MQEIQPLGLSANQWQFLSAPKKYVEASNASGRTLVQESTRRQFDTARDILSRLNGSYGEQSRRGILLADDVGLGKTTVAAIVAWVVASAGGGRGVRILAPNDVMMRRWVEELLSHVEPLQKCAPSLDVRRQRVRVGKVARLSAGSIQVVKHSYAASDLNLKCDLLIVDEAHRAKGESSAFSAALKRQKRNATRVLILTATPFSIRLDELQRMLSLIGGDEAHSAVRAFSRTLDDLYSGNTARDPNVVAEHLAMKARAAVEKLGPFVIRHGIEDLPREKTAFGDRVDWNIVVPLANSAEVELTLRMDRALRLAKHDDTDSSRVTNDARFHVGWRHFDVEADRLSNKLTNLAQPARAVVENHLTEILRLRKEVGTHSKMAAVSEAVKEKVEQGEKVVLFCHYHATAQELTAHLASMLPTVNTPSMPSKTVWSKAWDQVLTPSDHEHHDETLRKTFIRWLCEDINASQTWMWLGDAASQARLQDALQISKCRYISGPERVAEAAERLYHTLLSSKSSRAVLKAAADRLELLPGANGSARVLGVCLSSERKGEESFFIRNQQPDTAISIFNSPFGPDVLVVTDKLSEGIDLHRYCRHLIHYELDPSPIRTVQRNGRIRRVNSWASATGRPILYAYPAFRGTRDHRLVQIMKKRIDSFSLLLGGVQDFDVDAVLDLDEQWRNTVIEKAKQSLNKLRRSLAAIIAPQP